ncbi:MAG TPA: hypothetical protein VFT51_05310 [Bacillales bacterium]|nr:hypothetical protein [Bacillales bacterium]
MRWNNKSFSLTLLFSAMILVLAACGSGDGNAMTNNSEISVEKTGQESGQGMDENMDMDMGDENKKQDGMDDKSKTDSTGNKKNDSQDPSGDSGDSSKKEQENAVDNVLNVTAHDFAFNKEKFVATSGEITVHFKSVEGTHGFAIYKSEGSTEKLLNIVGKGTKTVNLKPGKYYIHCSVVCGGGHGQMDAVLVVKG